MYADSTSLSENAQSYSDLGFSVFPCHGTLNHGDRLVCTCGKPDCKDIAKHPRTAHGVKDATRDRSRIELYFSGPNIVANIGIAAGEPSGVSVLDVDDPAALTALESVHGPLPKTWTVETGSGGRHFYFRHDERWQQCKNAVKFAGGLDIRTTGGYVLAPPSRHKTGKNYRWLVPPDACELATAPDWLLLLIPKRDEPKPKPASPAGAACAASVGVGDARSPSEPIAVHGGTTLSERAKLYLESTPPAVSGESGHAVTFGVCCRLVELFGLLSDDDLIDALEAWNDRCSPPWSESELRHKLSDARAKVAQTTPTEPEPVPSTSAEPADDWPVLSDAALYGLVGDIVRAIEPETEADLAGVLVTLLTCLGNAIGNRPSFSVGGGTHHANLFACLVGETSSGKGQAWDVADYLMRKVDADWRKDSIAYGLSSGEGLVERLADPVDEQGELLLAPEVKRLLCLETEFSRPITAMRREGNTLSPLLRSAWDGQTLEVLTRGKSKLRASNAYVSIVAHITPSELAKLLSDSVETTNGFSNRFLWTLVRSSKDLPSGGDISVLDRFVEPLQQAIARARTISAMVRTPEAEKRWNDAYSWLKNASIRATERGRPQVLRLAMLFACLDSSPNITHHHLEAALVVWRYCDDSARLIFASADEAGKLEKRIRELVRSKPGIMRSELARSVSHKIPASRLEAAISWLVGRGDIVHVPIYTNRQADTYYPGVGGVGVRGIRVSIPHPSEAVPPNPPFPPPTLTGSEVGTTKANPPTPPFPPTQNVKAATLEELFVWKAENGIEWERRGDGCIWVTKEKAYLLTPPLEAAIKANQATLAAFVTQGKPEPPAAPPTLPMSPEIAADPLADDPFFLALREMT